MNSAATAIFYLLAIPIHQINVWLACQQIPCRKKKNKNYKQITNDKKRAGVWTQYKLDRVARKTVH